VHIQNHPDATDNELLDRFYEDGNNEWLGILLQRYTLLLLGTCMKYLKNEEEARDCVQQIFLKAITELHKYRVEYFKSWLYIVAKNHCLMRFRNKTVVVPVEEKREIGTEESNLEEIAGREALLQAMEDSLPSLNPEQKTCLTLFYLEKKSYREITDATGFTPMQVKSHIQNGKRNLRALVEKKIKNGHDRY